MHTKLSIRPRLNTSPQLVLTSKVLQVPGSEIEQFINQELAMNPALEWASEPETRGAPKPDSYYGERHTLSQTNNFSGSSTQRSFDESFENIAQRVSPVEKLVGRLPESLDKSEREIATHLLHRLDHRGYLVIPREELAMELGLQVKTIERIVQVLHQLEPPGIGALDIRECFLIQTVHLEAEGIVCEPARSILMLAWNEFLDRQWDRVARRIKVQRRVVEEACEFMRLNFCPYPLAMVGSTEEPAGVYNYADLIVVRDRHASPPVYRLKIPGEEEFELKVSASFERMLANESQGECSLSSQERTWIKHHLDQAFLVIGALRQRWETFRLMGEFLIEYQKDFLNDGPLHLKPLTRAVVAQKLNVHESTISRAVSNKVIQLPDGHLIPLSNLFDSSLAAKEAIRFLIRDSSKRLCDREIAEGLQSKGMKLSRRTVTKYRREIKLDSSHRQAIGV